MTGCSTGPGKARYEDSACLEQFYHRGKRRSKCDAQARDTSSRATCPRVSARSHTSRAGTCALLYLVRLRCVCMCFCAAVLQRAKLCGDLVRAWQQYMSWEREYCELQASTLHAQVNHRCVYASMLALASAHSSISCLNSRRFLVATSPQQTHCIKRAPLEGMVQDRERCPGSGRN